MEKIAFRNRFRIKDAQGNILRVNTSYDKNGVARFVEGFDTEGEAKGAIIVYCLGGGGSLNDYTIESYPEQYMMRVPVTKNEKVNSGLAKKKVFNGKGLRYNTDRHSNKSDNKYRPDKFYSKDVWLAQSAERSKGLSLVAKKGDSKKFRNRGVEDIETAMKVERLHGPRTTIPDSYLDHLVNSLIKQNFASAQELKSHLRSKGYSARRANQIFTQVYKQKQNG